MQQRPDEPLLERSDDLQRERHQVGKRLRGPRRPGSRARDDPPDGELPFPSVSSGSYEPPAADGTAVPENAPDGPNTTQPDSGAGAVVAQQAENLSVAEASVKPHRTTIRTPKRKRQAKAVVCARQDMEQRQTELDLSVQQRLDLPEPGTVAESDIEALRVADAELAELETLFSVGQGGIDFNSRRVTSIGDGCALKRTGGIPDFPCKFGRNSVATINRRDNRYFIGSEGGFYGLRM